MYDVHTHMSIIDMYDVFINYCRSVHVRNLVFMKIQLRVKKLKEQNGFRVRVKLHIKKLTKP